MSDREPGVRVLYLKLAVDALDDLDPALQVRARALLEPTLEQLAGAHALSFWPVARLLEMSEAAYQHGGAEALRALVSGTMRRALGSRFFGQAVRRAIALFGVTPPAAARWAPTIYRLTFRHCGTMHADRVDHHEAWVRFDRLPDACRAHPAYVAALGFALEFFFELTGVAGQVRRLAPEPGSSAECFVLQITAGA